VGKARGNRVMRDVFLAFVRVHVLHHAARERIFGVEMMEELERHGYAISPGTLYPLLHALEHDGLLTSVQEVVAGKSRRYYRTTPGGDKLLDALQDKIRELVDEVLPRPARRRSSKRKPGSR
jgi:PadR family transcriptional regulator PadR